MPRRRGDDVEALIRLNADESHPRYWAGVVGINVRRARREWGWSQSELAVLMRDGGWPLTQKLVSAVESNSRTSGTTGAYVPLTVDRLMLLGAVLKERPADLLNDQWQRRVRAVLPESEGSKEP